MWENENNKKETFTKVNALTDIKNLAKSTLFQSLGIIVFILIALLVLFSFFEMPKSFNVLGDYTVYYAAIVFSVFPILKSIVLLFKISNSKVLITTAKLVNITERVGAQPIGKGLNFLPNKPFRLHFSSYGEFRIPEIMHYKWSSLHKMDAKSIRNYSTIGDEFYIAVIDNKIYSVYNKKLFEYKE